MIIQGTLATLSVFGILCQGAVAEANGVIRNGATWHDTSGNEIWCNGGHMIEENGTFYWVGYETRPGQHMWNTKLYSSSNLVDWKFENNILSKDREFAILGWAGRPAFVYNRATRRYVVIFEAGSRDWYRHKVGFASCDVIDGRYQFERYEYPEENRSTGDQSVYQEGDDAYLVTVLDHPDQKPLNYSLAIFKLSSDFLSIESKVFEGFENGGREAPHIIKVDDIYYWFASGLRGWNSTATMYATAKSLEGPWSELKHLATDPDSPDSFNTQHDFVLPVTGSEGTTYLYVGDRYSQHHGKGTGRNIFLPLVWEDDVPKLNWYESWKIDIATGRYQRVHE